MFQNARSYDSQSITTPTYAADGGSVIQWSEPVLDEIDGYPEDITSYPRLWNILLHLLLHVLPVSAVQKHD